VFRSGTKWAAFSVRKGVAHTTHVSIGHQGEEEWEVLNGLGPGDDVIAYPGTEIKEGVRVRATTPH
jgi:HlyD family secretion protein